MNRIEISVVIPTFNRRDALRRCLETYGRQTLPAEKFEVIVADDGSTDGTGDVVRAMEGTLGFRLHYFRQENSGPARARNRSFPLASGDVVLITGDDIFPGERLLEEHRSWHAELFPDPHIGVLGHITWTDDPPPTPFMRWLEDGVQFAFHRVEHGQALDWRYLYTSNVSFKKRFIEKSGELFDERFPYAAYEDIEWGYRLAKKGLVLMYDRNAAAFHHHFTTLESSLRRMEKVGRSARYLQSINPELYGIISRDNSPKEWWKRALVRFAVQPAVAETLLLPLARFFERRGIQRYIFDLAHRYYFHRGLRK